jgi:hypothetical protein
MTKPKPKPPVNGVVTPPKKEARPKEKRDALTFSLGALAEPLKVRCESEHVSRGELGRRALSSFLGVPCPTFNRGGKPVSVKSRVKALSMAARELRSQGLSDQAALLEARIVDLNKPPTA